MKRREVSGKMVWRKDRSFYFGTRCLYSNPLWRGLFYKRLAVPVKDKGGRQKEFRKAIPNNLKDYFWGDLALAIFFFDDGWYDWQKETVRFSAGECPRQECEILVECLTTNFNLECEIYPLTGDPHHIFVKKTHYPEFYRRVLPVYEDFRQAFPRYDAVNSAMKNKVLVPPVLMRGKKEQQDEIGG
jgi:hypothetical protein